MAEVVLTKPAADALRVLPPPLDEAVLDALTGLESDPEAGSALRGRLRGVRSLRIGSFRILYTIPENAALVRVRAIRHRSVAYLSDPRWRATSALIGELICALVRHAEQLAEVPQRDPIS